jgi:hypothetical protein
MNNLEKSLFALIRLSIDNPLETDRSLSLTEKEWREMLGLANKHSLIGVTYKGIQKLDDAQKPPRDVFFDWFDLSTQILQQSKKQFMSCASISSNMKRVGMQTCILKGQGNALMYPDPYMRTPGDIDIWLRDTPVNIIKFVRKASPKAKIDYHHIEFTNSAGIDIEAHFFPSYMNDPVADKRLQEFFREVADRQFANFVEAPEGIGTFCRPTKMFNLVFQLTHLYRHIFHEGIGIRQMLDYYYLLKQGLTSEEKEEFVAKVKYLRMHRFLKAVMAILQRIFALPDDQLIVEPDFSEGDFLIEEMLIGGTFGSFDTRFGKSPSNSHLKHNIVKSVRVCRFLTHYPAEVIFEPYFRMKNFLTRRKYERELL